MLVSLLFFVGMFDQFCCYAVLAFLLLSRTARPEGVTRNHFRDTLSTGGWAALGASWEGLGGDWGRLGEALEASAWRLGATRWGAWRGLEASNRRFASVERVSRESAISVTPSRRGLGLLWGLLGASWGEWWRRLPGVWGRLGGRLGTS